MPGSQEERWRQPSLGCPFSPGQRQRRLSQSGRGAILRSLAWPHPRGTTDLGGSIDRAAGCHFFGLWPSPWGSSRHSEEAGLALVLSIGTPHPPPPPRCPVSSSDPHFEAVSFDLQKGGLASLLSLPQDLRVLQGQSPLLGTAQLQGAPLNA